MVWEIFNTIATNVGLDNFGTLVLIIVNLGSLIFFVAEFRIGSMVGMVLNFSLFMWFYNSYATNAFNYVIPLTITFIYLIILSLSLYMTSKAQGADFI